MQLDPRIRNAVPCSAVRPRKTKKVVRDGDTAVPMEKQRKNNVLQMYALKCVRSMQRTTDGKKLTDLLPNMSAHGPQRQAETPMQAR